MSQNKVLFKIKKHILYNDIKLIDLDVPVLFVCIDESKNRYLALCVDPDDCYYLVVPITSYKLIQMLNGQITMKNPFETSDVIYSINTAPDYIDDKVVEMSPQKIDDEDLPRDGAYFNLKLHDNLNDYISSLQSSFQINNSRKLILSDEWNAYKHYDVSLKEYPNYYDLEFSDLGCQNVNGYCNASLERYSIYNDLKFDALGCRKINGHCNVIFEDNSMYRTDTDYDLNNISYCDESEDDNTMSAA